MSTPTGHKIKIEGMYRKISITADSNGGLPTRIELLRTGEWPASSNKGPLTETVASLGEYKRNFDSGIAQSQDTEGNNLGLPVDYMHESWDKAALWIKAMEVAPSSNPDLPVDQGGMSLWATELDYTPAGRQAIIDGEFKCFSPSWWPASRGDWTDPEDPNITARNVIDGGGLTNIPFFKGLQSLTASNAPVNGASNEEYVIYIKADKETHMKLDELRLKELADLTAEEKQHLEDNKTDLSDEERAKFNLEAEPATPAAGEPNKNNIEGEPVADPELEAVTASIKSGEMVAVNASVFNTLQADVKAMKREKIEASVTKHVARGAVVADQIKDWADQIEANPAAEKLLAALPDNSQMASTIGQANVEEKTRQEAETELHEKVVAAKSEDANKGKSYADVRKSILASNKELAEVINGGNQ